jgi:hypothetical protein
MDPRPAMSRLRPAGAPALLWLVLAWLPGCGAGTVTPDPCQEVACSNHGICQRVEGQAVCRCEPGYQVEGLECQAIPPDPCQGVSCSGHGACLAVAGQASCQCAAGYQAVGLECQEIPTDPCAGVVCGSNAHCEAGACLCDPGTQGDPNTGCQQNSEEQRIRAKLIQIALAEVGMCEGVNQRPYMENQPGLWCYDFVAWVYSTAGEGLPSPLYLPQRHTDGLPAGWRPKAGDLIKYNFQHYAMVKELSPDGATVYTIEGNFNSCVTEYSTGDGQVDYYGTLEEFFP